MKHKMFLESLVGQVRRQPRGSATGVVRENNRFKDQWKGAMDQWTGAEPYDDVDDDEMGDLTPELPLEDEPDIDPSAWQDSGYSTDSGRHIVSGRKPQGPAGGQNTVKTMLAMRKLDKQIRELEAQKAALKAQMR